MTRSASMRTTTRNSKPRNREAQDALRKEFCDAYNFAPEQIGFDGDSLDPIFDFDALSVLSTRLCNLPHIAVDMGDINQAIGIATATGYAVLANGNTRKIFGSAVLNEPMHNGEPIKDIHQAVKVARARALRTILRAVGFDPVEAHRGFKKTGNVVELQPPATLTRDQERKQIHLLADELALVRRAEGQRFTDRSQYEKVISTFFPTKTSSKSLTDSEHSQLLAILRSWSRARQIATAPVARRA